MKTRSNFIKKKLTLILVHLYIKGHRLIHSNNGKRFKQNIEFLQLPLTAYHEIKMRVIDVK